MDTNCFIVSNDQVTRPGFRKSLSLKTFYKITDQTIKQVYEAKK